MTGLAAPEAEVAFCATLFCAAAVAWVLTERNGPSPARLTRAISGAHPGRPEMRGRAQRFGDTLLGDLRERLVAWAGGRTDGSGSPGRGLVGLCIRARSAWWCLPAGVLLGVWGESFIPVILGAVAVPSVSRLRSARLSRAAAERRESAAIDLCAATAGELRSGRLPGGALLAAGAEGLDHQGAALLAAARFGGDVPTALDRAARLPGASGLRGAAACWRVSADGGAGLADGLDRVADALRAERDQREELRSQLAGPRSTAAVLALLPAFGMLLGTAMGADPLAVLFHTPVGLGCLVVGGALEWAGLAWVARLVRAAEDGS